MEKHVKFFYRKSGGSSCVGGVCSGIGTGNYCVGVADSIGLLMQFFIGHFVKVKPLGNEREMFSVKGAVVSSLHQDPVMRGVIYLILKISCQG